MPTLIKLKRPKEIMLTRDYSIWRAMSWECDAFDVREEEFLEDCSDFVEADLPPPKKGTTKGSKKQGKAEIKTRSRHVLNKSEKKHAAAHITATNAKEITLKSLSGTAQQLSTLNDTLKNFCDSITPATLLFFTRHLKISFVRLYNECSTLKERYLQFQLKWHNYCSYFLVSNNRDLTYLGLHPADPLADDVVAVRAEWNKVCNCYSVSRDVAKTFLISFCSSVYNELLRQCQVAINPPIPATVTVNQDSDDVYYRFGGGAIADMLKLRYTKMRSPNCTNKDQISLEITILQGLSVHRENEKALIPAYLKYRDEGYMYFPCTEILPFLKAVDMKTKEHANISSFSEFGADFVKTISDSMENNSELFDIFNRTMLAKIPEAMSLPFQRLNGIFTELVRKLSHTRIQEFLDSYKQSVASKKGAATLSGLNLRDSLLGHHVNLKSVHQ